MFVLYNQLIELDSILHSDEKSSYKSHMDGMLVKSAARDWFVCYQEYTSWIDKNSSFLTFYALGEKDFLLLSNEKAKTYIVEIEEKCQELIKRIEGNRFLNSENISFYNYESDISKSKEQKTEIKESIDKYRLGAIGVLSSVTSCMEWSRKKYNMKLSWPQVGKLAGIKYIIEQGVRWTGKSEKKKRTVLREFAESIGYSDYREYIKNMEDAFIDNPKEVKKLINKKDPVLEELDPIDLDKLIDWSKRTNP